MRVPFLPKKRIDRATTDLIERYQDETGKSAAPPVPVEDIIEHCLNVDLEYMDFEKKWDVKGVLGATFVSQRLICANTCLLRDRQAGRLIFTFAHEAGHWVLHRKHVKQAQRNAPEDQVILCRASSAKLPIEWQADRFASSLLMPEESVRQAWNETYGTEPLIIHNVTSCFCDPASFDPCVMNWYRIAESIREAGRFTNVSKQALIIRLQDLELVQNQAGVQMTWSKAKYAC